MIGGLLKTLYHTAIIALSIFEINSFLENSDRFLSPKTDFWI